MPFSFISTSLGLSFLLAFPKTLSAEHFFSFGRLMRQLNELVTGIIFFQLLCGAIFCSTSIYQLDLVNFSLIVSVKILKFGLLKASRHINADFFILVFASTVSIATTLPYCYYSTHVSLCLQGIGDSAYKTADWPLFPPVIQKYILLIVGNSQQKRFFTGYNILNCSCETFKKVITIY